MARTADGRRLTESHRQAQLSVRAQVIKDFMRLWPIWQGDGLSYGQLVAATVPLVQMHHRTSSAVATAYYEAFRKAEQPGGTATPQPAPAVIEEQVIASLYATGEGMTRKAIAAGMSPQAAMQGALARTSGATTRHVLNGGRDALLRSTASDKRSQGWIRVTSGDTCPFCALLAGRGAVYSESSADFRSHDHCSCSAEPQYEGSQLPAANQKYRDAYNRAVAEARAAGELDRGTDNDLLNAFRRSMQGSSEAPAAPATPAAVRPGALSPRTIEMSDAAVEQMKQWMRDRAAA